MTRQEAAHVFAQVAQSHDPVVLVATALRTKSLHAREILAESAWPEHSPSDIQAWANDHARSTLEVGMNVPWLGRYAQVVALQAIEPNSFRLGRTVLEAISRAGKQADLPPHLRELLLQLRLADRDRHGATELVTDTSVRAAQLEAVEADLRNPYLFDEVGDEVAWMAAFNRALGSPTVVDVRLAPVSGHRPCPPFDRLTTDSVADITSDHRISVVMSSFRPGPALLTAVESVVRQTWTNWELLIVDDASGDDYVDVLREAAALDDRVRVIFKTLNGGTYRARNTALRQATGEFFTVVDSDDWIHPQAFEHHVQPMIADDALMGTISRAARVSENLELNRPGTLPRVASAASLMFRSTPVLSRIGFFDTTSKGADTEFRKRLELALGTRVRELPVVLSILRQGETLSSAEISRGWKHPARRSYRKLYEAWHQRISSAGGDPYLDPDEGRRFPEPRRWAKPIHPWFRRSAHIGLCIAGDWSAESDTTSMLRALEAAIFEERHVSVMHLDSMATMTRRDVPMHARAMELINDGVVEWIQPDDDIDVDEVVIHDPSVLQYPPTVLSHVRVDTVVVHLPPRSSSTRESTRPYCIEDVTERATVLFGVSPTYRDAPVDNAATPSALPPPSSRHALPPDGNAGSTKQAREGIVVEIAAGAPRAAGGCSFVLDDPSTQQLALVHVPLRSLADAERHDQVVIAYRREADEVVRRWLQCLGDRGPATERDRMLLDYPPRDVELIATRWDGVWRVTSPHPLVSNINGVDCTLPSGVGASADWATATWVETSLSCDVSLSSGSLRHKGINS